ncbi:hypothetical protein GQ55_5G435900 [Panicum hallii var. hallii]|uniref:Uncharacterized protein n=1 Tax=Panicum hallii var. hallii TaxID=1504633 RepID=A0A2T7DPH3_9POAL|nr:hypothetical protein GQ55_5G435900 [Panicum hallii var. hallii]
MAISAMCGDLVVESATTGGESVPFPWRIWIWFVCGRGDGGAGSVDLSASLRARCLDQMVVIADLGAQLFWGISNK